MKQTKQKTKQTPTKTWIFIVELLPLYSQVFESEGCIWSRHAGVIAVQLVQGERLTWLSLV